jgi:hypothetical protein
MALTKDQRDALGTDDYAVPGKRKLPIPDERHVSMAWDMVDRTQGLSDDERHEARQRIIRKAKALGMDTGGWSTIKAMALDAMSLMVPAGDHVNKMPFSGILTRLDEPSDEAPHGSGNRRVILTRDAAEKALPTILGMAVDFTPSFNGHDAQKKIGLITEATIEGNAVHIEGFIYAADFPDTAVRIRAMKDELGFSYEMKNVLVADPGADTLVIESCVFTGAAILRKADAAYHTTSLAASKDGPAGDMDMTKEELETILAAATKPLIDKIDALEAGQKVITTDIAASKEVQAKVAPHADAMRACAAGMQAAGIGGHAKAGHVTRLNRMADQMEAEAAMGKVPHIYRDHDFLMDAGADTLTASAEPSKDIVDLKAGLDSLTTLVKDLTAKSFTAAAEPERKTVGADVLALLSKNGIDLEAGGDAKKVSVAQFDDFLDKAGKHGTEAITLKLQARSAGLLAA